MSGEKEALEYLKSTGFNKDPPDDAVGELYDYSKKMKEVFCINCLSLQQLNDQTDRYNL